MTPKQVRALSDIELNLRVIESVFGQEWHKDVDLLRLYRDGKLNYLEDHNITMPLAFKHGITVIKNHQGSFWAGTDIQAGDGFAIYMENDTENKNPLRAICECLVLIALADHS